MRRFPVGESVSAAGPNSGEAGRYFAFVQLWLATFQ